MNPYQTTAIPARHPQKETLSPNDKIALAHTLTPLLFGSILVAVVACVCFMAWNEPPGSQELSAADKRLVSYGSLAVLFPTLVMVSMSIRSALRISRPRTESIRYMPARQNAAA